MEIIEKAKNITANCDNLTIAYIREDGYPRASTITKLRAEGIKTIYLSTAMQALKTRRIQANEKASLCIRAGGDNITLTGKLRVSQDNGLRSSLWQSWMLDHFPDGANGESYCLLIFETEEADFWIDGESAAVTGRASL